MADEKGLKRCINCGYLYAEALTGRTAKDSQFDPERLRQPSVIHELQAFLNLTANIDRGANAIKVLHDDLTWLSYDKRDRYGSYLWKECAWLHCLKRIFEPPMVLPLWELEEHAPETGPERYEYLYRGVSAVVREVLDTIWHADRESCTGYFPYHPGFSSREHIDLQLEDIRMRREEAFQELAIKVQSYLGGQSIAQQRKANLLTLGLLIVAAVSLALSLTSIVISILIATGRLS